MPKKQQTGWRDPNTCTSCGTPLEPVEIPADVPIRELTYGGRVVTRKLPGALFVPARWCAPCEARIAENTARYQAEDAARERERAERLYDAIAPLEREAAIVVLVERLRQVEDEA